MFQVNLRETAPDLDGNESLSDFLKKHALAGHIGRTSAMRLVACGIDSLVTAATTELLIEVTESVERAAEIDVVAPAIRVVEDFCPGEEVWFHDLNKGDRWRKQHIDALETSSSGDTDAMQGIVLRDHQLLRKIIDPRWPALVPADFYCELKTRKHNHQHKQVNGVGRFFFALSFYTPEIDDHVFRDVARNAFRHFELMTPPKKR